RHTRSKRDWSSDVCSSDLILPVLGNIYVDKLTVAKCQKTAQQWKKEAPRTFKRYIRYVNNVLDYGVNLELLASNPMRKIVRPKEIGRASCRDRGGSEEMWS